MKKILFGLLWLYIPLYVIVAQNYPFRSDVLWVTVPDHSDWLYRVGEKAEIGLQFYLYGIPQDGLTVSYELADDLMDADKQGTVILKNGRATIPVGTMQKPGFRDCRLTAVVNGKKYKHHVKVGFSPEKLTPYTQLPADFNLFWENALSGLRKCALKYTMIPVERYSDERIRCYLVQILLNNSGQSVYGYLTKPAKTGKYPVVFCPPGAGIKTIKDPLKRRYYADEGCIRFEMEIHGLNPELDEQTFKEISSAFNGRENGYLSNNLDNKDNYYMKRVYTACVRAIDFLAQHPEWDGKNIIAQGGSQGGALALITTGLDSRITACVANHPALSDMAGYKAGRAGGYPHFFTRMKGMDTPDKIETMAYYDVVNFVRNIRVPVLLTWGYNDDVCPPTTSYIVYNLLSGPKEALITPVNEHWTSDETEYGHLKWIQKQLK
ncbi:MAG: acetylxylan esterase [Bacteroidales bacterium]